MLHFRAKSAVIAALAYLFAGAFPAMAQEPDGEADAFAIASEAFIEGLIADLAAVASDTASDDAERARAMQDVLRDDLAVEAMGRFALSADLREAAEPETLERYDALFPDYISTVFASQIDALARQTIEVRDVRRIRDNEVVVRSAILNAAGRDAATIEWRLRDVEGEPKVLDVLVARISRLVTLRAEFRSVASRDGLGSLVSRMQMAVDAVQG